MGSNPIHPTMNIFAVDVNPIRAAGSLCDRHVVKMPLESTQMICTVARFFNVESRYKSTHEKHPCVEWLAGNRKAWNWHLEYTRALFNEYTYRYGRKHRSQKVFEEVTARFEGPTNDSAYMPSFVLCMPDKYKKFAWSQMDAVTAYRHFYIMEKRAFAKWDYTSPPPWFI